MAQELQADFTVFTISFVVTMAIPSDSTPIPTESDTEEVRETTTADRTLDLLQKLVTRVEKLEAAGHAATAGPGPSSSVTERPTKRPRDYLESDIESGGEEEVNRDKRARTFEESAPTKAFLRFAFAS